MNRRAFLRGGLLLAASPAIVRVASIMPVRAMPVQLPVMTINLIQGNGLLTLNQIVREAMEHFRNSNSLMNEWKDEVKLDKLFMDGCDVRS